LILNRSRKRALNLRAMDRIIAGICALLVRPARAIRSAIVLKPSTLLHFHDLLVKRKYQLLFSQNKVVEMKRRNPNWVVANRAADDVAFGIEIDKDVVPRDLS